jgi:hypothetical protein
MSQPMIMRIVPLIMIATVSDKKQATRRIFPTIAASRTPLWLPSGSDVGVGLFPEGEEIFVGGERATAGESASAPWESFACKAFARATPRCANATVQRFQTIPLWSMIFWNSAAASPYLDPPLGTPRHERTRHRARKYWRRTQFVPTRLVKRLAAHSGQRWLVYTTRHFLHVAIAKTILPARLVSTLAGFNSPATNFR